MREKIQGKNYVIIKARDVPPFKVQIFINEELIGSFEKIVLENEYKIDF